ncbi:MAG: hypothetical protein EZS28_021023 [Streblomastix strix]|uniref:Uncharacterized protein n=1 Tax=Streblomastix strix TaxID=222440 RepID=A0A5J4VLY5_9EUKA|nr:MAG: hypothetical protein EZS28_021023 [Streblomastix strix]
MRIIIYMTFNIALLFGLAALSAMVPLQRNDEQRFPKYTIETGNILREAGTNILIQYNENGKFGRGDAETLNILSGLEPIPWAKSDVYTSAPKGAQIGAKQYVDDGFYDFQAAVLYAYNAKTDIVPSYYNIFDCYPKKTGSGTQIIQTNDGTVPYWKYITFLPGVADEKCYGTTSAGTCKTTCSTYGKDLWITSGGDAGRQQIKTQLANFGPILDENNKTLLYGWSKNDDAMESTTFLGLKRVDGELQRVEVTYTRTDFFDTHYFVYQSIDCSQAVTSTTTDECPCPKETDAAYKTDERAKKGGVCYVEPTPDPPKVVVTASGATRAAWTVIATVLLLPLLSMW